MNIKDSHVPSAWRRNPIVEFLRRLRKKAILVTFLVIVAFAFTSLASIYYGMHLYKVKKANTYQEFLENAIQTKLNVIPNYFKGYFSSNPERITIDIKHKHFQRIAYKREMALANGVLLTSSEDFVPAQIRYKDKALKVKLRLKGDWTDHLLGEKWSFRIKVKGDHTLFGMKQFSIHHPRTRNFIYEWIFLRALKREGLVALRYKFVEVTLNGKDLGIYALEEHFEKRLIENNQYREGPILKYNENNLWTDRAAHHRFGNSSPTGLQQEGASSLDVFKTGTILNDPTLFEQFRVAHHLLENFRNKKLPTHQAFDITKLAIFFALSDVLGAEHSVMWQNLRFYYNPVTSLLEPVGFDANAGRSILHVVGSNRALYKPVANKFKDVAFTDPVFFEEYLRHLERISTGTYLDELLQELDGELKENLNILYREFPYFHYSEKIFYKNLESIRTTLRPAKGLHAYFYEKDGHWFELELGNIQAMPIEVLGVSYQDMNLFKPVERVILQPKISYGWIDYHKAAFTIPNNVAWDDSMRQALKLNYKVLGTGQLMQEPIHLWPRQLKNFSANNFMRQPANAEKFDFLKSDPAAKTIFIQSGKWTVAQDMILPAGYRVVCREGTELDLVNSATILTRSPVDFQGSEEHPIVVHSTDSTGQGFVVLRAQEESILDYVTFHNLTNPVKSGWKLTGAVTFYESPVFISHCRFSRNQCEDGLNIVRSNFTIDKTLFKDIFADAFDGDFTKGTITKTSFIACGNDAIDVSGSTVEVRDVFIDGAGDKGLSAGENSDFAADNVEIINSEIAVASKDMSTMKINKLKVSDCQVGFTIYQKKPEFDFASVKVEGYEKRNLKIPYLVEERSKLAIDGAVIAANRQNVKEILYGVEFGKSSK
ncbi:MAG: CotH kinase family protein [bacterium]